MARNWIFLWCTRTDLSLLSNSSKDDRLSLYAIFRERKCKESIFEFRDLSQDILSNGENENYDITNAFMRTLRLCEGKILQSLARAFSFLPAFLHIIVLWFLKLNSRSIRVPSNFTSWVSVINALPILAIITSSLFPHTSRLHLESFSFI